MSEPRPDGRLLRWALLAVMAVGAAAVLYVIVVASIKPDEGRGLQRFATGSLHRLQATGATAAPSTRFRDAEGRELTVADLPGEVVVVNLWATWCAPCVVEMPTLAKLARAYPGRVTVVPVSLDTVAKAPEARAFIARHPPLAFHHEPNFALAAAVKAQGLPVTLIYEDGVEQARVLGEADWSSPEATRLIEALLAD